MRTPSSLQNQTKSRHHKQENLFSITPTIVMSNMVTQTQPSTQHDVLDLIEDHERDKMENTTSTVVTSNMMVTQTQPSAQVLDQMEDALVRTHHNGTMNEDENKLGRLEKVCIKKTMIQMRLDGSKAILKKQKKLISVKRHYRHTKTTNIQLKKEEEANKHKRVGDPEYQLTLKLLSKIRSDELMELRNRVFK